MFSRSWGHKNKCFLVIFALKISVFTVFSGKKHQPTNLSRNVVESTGYVVDSTTFPKMLSNRRELCRVEKCGRILEKCCRVDENSGNVVESTRNVVESTTFCFLLRKKDKLSNRQEMLASRLSFRNCRIDEKCCRVDVIFNFHGKKSKVVNVVESTTFSMFHRKRKGQIDEKCCRVDEIFGNVVEPARNVVELTTFQISTGKGKELSTRQHFRKCCRTDEKCCRVGDTGNGVESTRNVVESTTFKFPCEQMEEKSPRLATSARCSNRNGIPCAVLIREAHQPGNLQQKSAGWGQYLSRAPARRDG